MYILHHTGGTPSSALEGGPPAAPPGAPEVGCPIRNRSTNCAEQQEPQPLMQSCEQSANTLSSASRAEQPIANARRRCAASKGAAAMRRRLAATRPFVASPMLLTAASPPTSRRTHTQRPVSQRCQHDRAAGALSTQTAGLTCEIELAGLALQHAHVQRVRLHRGRQVPKHCAKARGRRHHEWTRRASKPGCTPG